MQRDFLRALFAESLIVVLLNTEEFLAERITVRTIQKGQLNGMTLTQYINAFLPGSTIEQVSEEWKIRQSDFNRKPNTIQINVTRNWQNDVAHKTADLSDRLLQRKVGFGW